MLKIKYAIILIAVSFFPLYGLAQQDTITQQQDTTQNATSFSGSLGLTNNGFSIIPSFSLNSPAVLLQLSWKKKKYSIDPDIRLTPGARKGSMIFWFRYYPVQKGKFSMRMGIHPAFNLQIREITENGATSEITQMRRFIAWELSPNYQIKKNWGIGIYYLQGNGLQKDGPRTTHYVNLNTSISNIKIGRSIRLKLIPAIYYLYVDGHTGNYFTATGILSHAKLPFTLQSDINQTFRADLPGNKDFLWNISVRYNFSKKLMAIK